MSRKLHVPSPREPAPSLHLLHNEPRMEKSGVPPECLVPTAAVLFSPLSSPTREVSSSAWRGWMTRAPEQAEPGSKPDQVLSSSLSLPLTCPVSLWACWSVHLGVASLSSPSHPPLPHGLH